MLTDQNGFTGQHYFSLHAIQWHKSNEGRNLVLYPHQWANQLSLSHSSPHNKAKLHNMLKIVMQHVHFINIMLKFAPILN